MALQRDVSRRAKARAVVGAFTVLVVVGESSIGAWLVATDPSAHARWMAAFLIGFSLLMAVIFFRSQRGLWRSSAKSPEALLGLMERRIEAGRRLARLAPFTSALGCSAVAALVLSADAPNDTRIFGVALAAAVFVFTLVMRRFGLRKLEARRALLARWRSELPAG
jgi:hypothetical protein